MTHLIEILLIVSIITSVIMLMLLIILKVGVTVTSRPLTKEEIEKLENRKWPWKRKPKVEDSSESTMPTESAEVIVKPKEVAYAEKEQTAIKSLLDTISKDAGIDSKCSFYRKRFLKCKRIPNRSRVYIDKEDLDLIRSLLPIIDPKATISGFVSNIVADHLDRYKPEIIKMYNDERAKIM